MVQWEGAFSSVEWTIPKIGSVALAGIFGPVFVYVSSRYIYNKLFYDFDRTKAIPLSKAPIDNQIYDTVGDWWDARSPMSPLHSLNPTRLVYIQTCLSNYIQQTGLSKGEAVFLDIGCGGGLVSEPLAEKGYSMIGIDLSAPTLHHNRVRAQEKGLKIDYREGSAYDLSAFSDSSVDGIVIVDVLEHLHDLPSLAQEFGRVLKKGGIVVFDTFNRTAKSHFIGIQFLQEKPFALVPPNVHNWSLFIKPEELKAVFSTVGIQVQELKGLNLKMNPKAIKSLLLKDVSGIEFFVGGDLQVQYIGFATKL